MTDILLHNTLTRKRERFEPLDLQNVRMYVCGPTVYDRAHLGNARPVVVFDVLFRLLRQAYGADHVTYVRNFTDVDDKINARAAATGRSIGEITDETIGWFHDDMGALGVLTPTHEPRATRYIAPMVSMIETLIAAGHAYEAEGHVLFSVDSYKSYGELSGRSVDDMIAGARVEVAPYKRDPMDFVLWKPSTGIEPGWDSPWGVGRPGWHIECSAMARDLLGDTFDIHGGGLDLQFPHHENEIAQSRCAHPDGGFARVWMHNEMLQVEGKKMSKSLGNFFTVRDLLDRGVPGEVIRFVFLSTHYRKPMDWTEAKASEARATLAQWGELVSNAAEEASMPDEIVAALSDDLNTHGAVTALHRFAKDKEIGKLVAGLRVLGFDPKALVDLATGAISADSDTLKDIERLLSKRQEFRSQKNYVKSDIIGRYLNMSGVTLQDGKSPSWKFDYNQSVFGWMAISEAAAQGKSEISLKELENLAIRSGVDVVARHEDGSWKQVGTMRDPEKMRTEFLSLAKSEAGI